MSTTSGSHADLDAIFLKFPFLAGDDPATRQVRSIDWAATPLGPIDGWPAPLRIVLGTMLKSRNPMLLYWGPQLIHFFNAAFIPSLDARQFPDSMGQPGEVAWSDIWPVIGPKLQAILQGGPATWDEDQLIPGLRHGRIVDIYWNYSFTPITDEQGHIGGVLVAATETTARMLEARRQRATLDTDTLLSALSPKDVNAPAAAMAALGPAWLEVPFAAYLSWPEADAEPTVLAAQDAHAPALAASLPPALRGLRPQVADAALRDPLLPVRGRLDLHLPGHTEPVTDLVLLPARFSGAGAPDYLAFGLNPRVPLDAGYTRFLQRLADEVSSTVRRCEDQRERERAFAEHANLLHQAPVAIAVLTGPEQTYTLVNPLYCQIVGRTAQQLLGLDYVVALPELIGTPFPGILKRVYETGERYVTLDTQVPLNIHGVLQDRYFSFNLEPMRDLHQRITGLMALAVDVTDQVQARAALERSAAERLQLLERVQQAARGKDEFMAMLGHELRNPLAPIVSALHVMARKGGDFERERGVIERQVKHLTRLVDDLMDVARIARGRIRLEPSLTRAAVILQRAAEMVQPLMAQRGHQLTVQPPERPILWWGDSDRLVQAVGNLLTNAARYTPPGGQIGVSARRAPAPDGDGEELVIEVVDNGIGLPPEALRTIFDEFHQLQRQASDRAHGGLGLGLALVKSLVQMHEGRVEAHSAGTGQGSRFVVRLPLRPQPDALALPAAPAQDAARNSRRVLLVDDNRDAVELMADALALQGHEVRVAFTPDEALALVDRVKPEVAVLDVGLPGMDGHELARRLRARAPDAVLVALSGYGQPADLERGRASGFAHYLVKPVDPEKLLQVVQSAG